MKMTEGVLFGRRHNSSRAWRNLFSRVLTRIPPYFPVRECCHFPSTINIQHDEKTFRIVILRRKSNGVTRGLCGLATCLWISRRGMCRVIIFSLKQKPFLPCFSFTDPGENQLTRAVTGLWIISWLTLYSPGS